MSYAAQTNYMQGTPVAVRETGSIVRGAQASLHQMECINARLESVLDNLRQSPPQPIAAGANGAEPSRPLADTMDRLERSQSRTGELLSEIESLVG